MSPRPGPTPPPRRRSGRRWPAFTAAVAVALGGAVAGTVVHQTAAGAAQLARPDFRLPFTCGQRWQLKTYLGHNPDDKKIDMYRYGATTEGSPVLASAAGQVHETFAPGGVEINHGNRWFTVMLHMRGIVVRPGQQVARGQLVGYASNVGTSVAHLHYEQLYDSDGNGDVDNADIQHAVIQGVYYDLRPGGPFPIVTSTNCHPRDSLGVYRPSTQEFFAAGYPAVQYGNAGDLPFAGDFDGDGHMEPGVYRNGTVYIRPFNLTFGYGNPGDRPFAADFTGDGKDEIGVYRPSTRQFFIRGGATITYGNIGDIPLAGDFDGDGLAEHAVYRPSTSTFYIRHLTLTIGFGNPGDKPFVGDFNGDGKDEIGVFRPSTATMYIRGQSATGTRYGNPGDTPLPAYY